MTYDPYAIQRRSRGGLPEYPSDPNTLLDPRETSLLLGVSINLMNKWRQYDIGPPWIMLPNEHSTSKRHVRYRYADIVSFIWHMRVLANKRIAPRAIGQPDKTDAWRADRIAKAPHEPYRINLRWYAADALRDGPLTEDDLIDRFLERGWIVDPLSTTPRLQCLRTNADTDEISSRKGDRWFTASSPWDTDFLKRITTWSLTEKGQRAAAIVDGLLPKKMAPPGRSSGRMPLEWARANNVVDLAKHLAKVARNLRGPSITDERWKHQPIVPEAPSTPIRPLA